MNANNNAQVQSVLQFKGSNREFKLYLESIRLLSLNKVFKLSHVQTARELAVN